MRLVVLAGAALAAGCDDAAVGTAPAATWTELPGDVERGAALFEQECVLCHADGGGTRLTACVYEEYPGWAPGDLAGWTLDQLVLQVVYGSECMPPMAQPLEHANGLGEPPMFTREEVEDVVSYVADRYGRP